MRKLLGLNGLLPRVVGRGQSVVCEHNSDTPYRRRLGGALCAVVVASVGLFASAVARADNYALLIGVGEFPRVRDVKINLPGIDVDLDNMQQMVMQLGVPRKNITRLFNASATLDRVTDALREHAQRLTKDDRLYLYFTTHGGQITNFNNDAEADGYDEFLVFHDLNMLVTRDPETDADVHKLEGVMLDDDLGVLLADIKATTIAIIDACSSATATKSLNFGQPKKADTLKATGKFISAGWMKKVGNRFSGEKRQPYDIPVRDNLVVLAASQDRQEALASEKGSVFTNALISALDHVPEHAVTPFCLHHYAYRDIKQRREKILQDPAFSGKFTISNQSLHDAPLSALAAFNHCLGGEMIRVTKRKAKHLLGTRWRLEFQNAKESYLFGYVESARGIERVYFDDKRLYTQGVQQVKAVGVAPELSATGPWGAGLLIANVDDQTILPELDFAHEDWANKLNVHHKKISSMYSEL